MQIEKIKINKDSSIAVEFSEIIAEKEEGDIYRKIRIRSNSPAHKGFYDVLTKLKPYACSMIELPEKEEKRISVKGITFNRTKEGILGVVLHLERKLDYTDIPIVIKTPCNIEEPYSNNGGYAGNVLDPGCASFLYTLMEEAEKYVSGFREQAELNLKQESVLL